MQRKLTSNFSYNINERDQQEDPLDTNFKHYIIMLQLICSRHTNCTNLVLCRKWVRRLAYATKEERYARNCLMSLLCNQITFGHLSKPFTDGRNLNPNYSLHNILLSVNQSAIGNQRNQFLKRRSEPDSRSFAFRNYNYGTESLRQRSLSDSCSFDRRIKPNMGFFHNYSQTSNQSHNLRGQFNNREYVTLSESAIRKQLLERNFQGSSRQRSESANRPYRFPTHLREDSLRSKNVGSWNEVNRTHQILGSPHIGSQCQYSTRGVAGATVAVSYLHQNQMDRAFKYLYNLKMEYNFLSNKYRRIYKRIEQLRARMQHKYVRSNNCQKDHDNGGIYRSYTNSSNHSGSVSAITKRMELLNQLIGSAHNNINQLSEITSSNRLENQQEILQDLNTEIHRTMTTNCRHQLFSKSLTALSYNDRSFDEFLQKSDIYVDKLMYAIFESNSEVRKQFVAGDLKKLWEIMSEQYRKKHKSNMKQHRRAEQLHTGLNQLRMLTILKKLFLENCVDKLNQVDKVVNRLDQEFALMKKHL